MRNFLKEKKQERQFIQTFKMKYYQEYSTAARASI
jgi:hypothetical protein